MLQLMTKLINDIFINHVELFSLEKFTIHNRFIESVPQGHLLKTRHVTRGGLLLHCRKWLQLELGQAREVFELTVILDYVDEPGLCEA